MIARLNDLMADREKLRAEQERRRILREEFAEFLAAWRKETNGRFGEWVPLRILPTTGLMAYELQQSGFIEINCGDARPLRWTA